MIEVPRVVNMRHYSFSKHPHVFIARPSKWGNPFRIGVDGSRRTVIEKYEEHIRSRPDLLIDILLDLEGADLICWCHPLPCHGDVLVRLFRELYVFE